MPEDLFDEPTTSKRVVVSDDDRTVLRSQLSVTKLGVEDSSLRRCTTLSMTELPLHLPATKDGEDMANYISNNYGDSLQQALSEGRAIQAH